MYAEAKCSGKRNVGRRVPTNAKDGKINAIKSWSDIAATKPALSVQHEQPRKQTIYIQVDLNKIGQIVGHHGTKIQQIQKQTNTEIIIDRKVCESEPTRQIKITGLPNDTEKARQLIFQIVNKKSAGHSSNSQNKSVVKKNSKTKSDLQQKQGNCSTESTGQSKAKLPAIIKHFYAEDPDVTNMSPEKVRAIRIENDSTTVEFCSNSKLTKKVPNPIENFHQCFRNHPEIMEIIDAEGFRKPSAIQAQAWPILLDGFDLVAIVETVVENTHAFLLPALIHINGQNTPRSQRSGPTLLILTSNREMIQRIEKEVNKFTYNGMKCASVHGGKDQKKKISICRCGFEIVIATPKTINDLIITNEINLKSVSYLVLYEADRLLNLGFESQIKNILLNVHPNRQSVITTANWSPEFRLFTRSCTKNPIQMWIGSLSFDALNNIKQTVVIFNSSDDKYQKLYRFLKSMNQQMKIIIFCNNETQLNYLDGKILFDSFNFRITHDDLDQSNREQALEDFANGTVQILLTTDVARKINISNITHVINYDFPDNIDEYMQRKRRINCGDQNGKIISFFTINDSGQAKDFISVLEMANQIVPVELYSMKDIFEMNRSSKSSSNLTKRKKSAHQSNG